VVEHFLGKEEATGSIPVLGSSGETGYRSEFSETAAEAFLRDAQGRNLSQATLENYRTFLLGPRPRQFLVDHQVREVRDVTTGKLRTLEAESPRRASPRRPSPLSTVVRTSSASVAGRAGRSTRRRSSSRLPASPSWSRTPSPCRMYDYDESAHRGATNSF
jgi:hypothetical protein